ncbi:MAG: hypothetical protein K9G62_05310, partial [Alphaproteobacteria bacterium]|nr:hypothetical protein [Alphaproteobacteria bacterium]
MADDIKRADELLEAKADDNDFFRLGGGQHKFDLQSFAARNGVAANNVSAAYNGENSAESQEHKDFELLNIVILQTSLSRLYESLRDLKKTLETVRESLRVLRLQEHILLEDMRHNLEQQRDIRFDLQNLNKALEKKEHEIVAQRDVVSDLKSEVEKASHKTEKTRGEALPLQDRVMAYEQTLKNTDLITLDGPEVGDLQVVWQDERGHYFVDSPCGEILVVERDKLAEIKRQTAQGKITADRAPSGLKKQIQDFQDLQGQFQVSEGEYVECH